MRIKKYQYNQRYELRSNGRREMFYEIMIWKIKSSACQILRWYFQLPGTINLDEVNITEQKQ